MGQNSKPGRLREPGPHHAHGQQFPFLLAFPGGQGSPRALIFLGGVTLRDRRFPAKHFPIVPWIPKNRERRQLRVTFPSALQELAKFGIAHPKNLQEDLHQGEKCGGRFITGLGFNFSDVSVGIAGINLSMLLGWAQLS